MKIMLSTLIKQGREKAGLTRAELANLLGVSPASVSYWESGQKIPSGDLTIEMIKLLNLAQDIFPESFTKTELQNGKPSLEDRVKILEGLVINKS